MSELLKPKITVIDITVLDTEYSHNFLGSTRQFSFQLRTSDNVRFAFVADLVATSTDPYATLKAGQAYSSPEKFELPMDGLSLYVANANGSVQLEIVEWY